MPTYIVTGPDGKEYEAEGPEGSTPEQALQQVRSHVEAQSAPQPQQPQGANPGILRQAIGTLANGLRIGPMGIMASGVNEALTRPGQVAYPAGAAVTDTLANSSDEFGNKVSPEVAAGAGVATNFALNAIPALAGFGGGGRKTAEVAANAVRNTTIREARDAGYVIPPTATGGGTVAKAVESIGGKAAVGQEAAIRNQQVTNALARKAAGLAEDEPITEAALAAARKEMSAPYRAVADTSPRAKQALEKLEDARLNAKDAWAAYNKQGGSANRKLALAEDAKVETLERVIEREATATGNSGLVEKVRQARIALAKNHDVERALNIGTGDVDAHVIARMLDKRGLNGMTGELRTIGKFANAFSTFSREAPAGQSAPGVSKLTPYAATLLGLGGYGASEHYGMGPWGAAAAALPILSGPARALALSRMMQRGVPTTSAGMPAGAPSLAALLALRAAQQQSSPALDPYAGGPLSR